MCGIVGYFGRRGDRELLRRMTDLIIHRGPDDEGFLVGEDVGLGMRRLAIIDRAGGAQPIFNRSREIAVVYNGEIYNHRELRKILEGQGYHFATGADTEVLVHGYEAWGEEGLLARLNGMFAFAIHDRRQGRLVLARDRLGIKPLYYTRRGGILYFASEVKAFAAVEEIPLALNTAALGDYLQLRYVPAPRTLFEGIDKLPAGHVMVVEKSGEKISRYWRPQIDRKKMSDGEYQEKFAELFKDAVRIRMMGEVPLGAYLSEGLDSNLVTWAMTQETSQKVTTYSIGFGGKHDETPGARRSAEKLGTDHHETHFEESNFEDLAKAVWHLDEPIGDIHILPNYILAREAKKDLTIVLLGEGADESLYGYPFYKVAWLSRWASRLMPQVAAETLMPMAVNMMPLGALNAVFPMPADIGPDSKRHIAAFARLAARGSGEQIFRHLTGLFSDADIEDLGLPPRSQEEKTFPLDYFSTDLEDASPDGLLANINNAQFSGWLQDNILLRHDKMAMAHSVECRVPFLDHRLVEFMAGVPRRLKISGWKDKILARRFAREVLGPEIAARPKKPFFLPMERFVSTKFYRQFIGETLSGDRVKRRGLFRPEKVRELVAVAETGDFLAVKRVMSLAILETWHRTLIDDVFQFKAKKSLPMT